MDGDERYARLDRLDVETETALAVMAREFFLPLAISRRRKPSPGAGITPATSREFMEHLKAQGLLGGQPDHYIHQIRDLRAPVGGRDSRGHGRQRQLRPDAEVLLLFPRGVPLARSRRPVVGEDVGRAIRASGGVPCGRAHRRNEPRRRRQRRGLRQSSRADVRARRIGWRSPRRRRSKGRQ